jgi:hypothetical protein
MKKMLIEGNQINNFMSSSGSGTVINYGSGSGYDFLTSYGSYGSGSGSGSTTLPLPPAFGLIYEGTIGQPRKTTSLCNPLLPT